MYTPTQNYGLAMPSYGDEADIGVINDMVTAQVDELLFQNRTISAPPFETTEAYTEGDLVVYENVLYRFTSNKAAGAWDSSKVVQTSLAAEIESKGSGASALADLTDTDIDTPVVGEVLTWNGDDWVNAEGTPTVTKTATGKPIELTDAANAPLVKCVTEIQGSQDLHGYDKPWVGGAGVNKYNENLANGKTATNAGITFSCTNGLYSISGKATSTTVNAWILGDYNSTTTLFTIPAGTYTFSVTNGNGVIFQSYDGNTRKTYSAMESGITYTFENNVNITALKPRNHTVDTTYDYTFHIQIESGSTATSYAPYSNICPITAYTEGEIEVRGKNAFDGTVYKSGYAIDGNGAEISASNYSLYKFVGLDGNNILSFADTNQTTEVKIARVGIYNENGNVLHVYSTATYTTSSGRIELPFDASNSAYVVVSLRSANATDIQIESGTTATAYEPYTSTTHTTTYPSAIYRGSEDCVKGEVTSEWGVIDSYAGETLPGEWISDRDEYAPGTTPTTGAQVAYALATPTTSSVTPTNLPIKSLSGYNHIESSTGEMEIEYITQTYQPLVDLIDEAADTKHTYSTTEHVVGKWIDGKTIYEKTYTNATEQSVSYQTWTPTVISATDIDRIVNLFTTRNADGGTYIPVVTRKENGYVEIFAAVGWTYNNITIQYTKTSSNNRSLSKGSTDSLRAEISGVKDEGEELTATDEKTVKKAQSAGEETKEEADETEGNADEMQDETVTE